jgi:excisionase family DNA binding protein
MGSAAIEIPLDQKDVYTIPEVRAVANVGNTQVYEGINSGALKAVKRGARTLIRRQDLLDWISSWPAYTPRQIAANTRPRRPPAAAAPAPPTPNKRAAAAGRKAAVAQRKRTMVAAE